MYSFEDMFRSLGRRLDDAFYAIGRFFRTQSILPDLYARATERVRDSFSRASDALYSVRTRVWLSNAQPFAKPVILCALLATGAIVAAITLTPRAQAPDPRHAQLESAVRARILAANAEAEAKKLAEKTKKPVKTFAPAQRPVADLFGKSSQKR